MVLKRFCDYCGKEIPERKVCYVRVEVYSNKRGSSRTSKDYCEYCYDNKILDILRNIDFELYEQKESGE